jgi:hypothetical protein
MTTTHVYVDESKRSDYLVIAAAIMPPDLTSARRDMTDLLLGGQSRLHMVKENAGRQRKILGVVAELKVAVTIYQAPRGSAKAERDLRRRCLDRLVADLAPRGHAQLALELDETLLAWDRKVLHAAMQREQRADSLRYRHERAAAEPLLAIPDAVAWAWGKGGDWRRRAEANVVDVIST